MTRLALVLLALSITTHDVVAATTLTFDDAVALATREFVPESSPLESEIEGLRKFRVPNVRLELAASDTRTGDPYSEGPFDLQIASSAIAFDYPIWDSGSDRARLDAVSARLRRSSIGGQLDDARYAQLLDAFGELLITQRQSEIIRAIVEAQSANGTHSSELLASGEISNLTAVERREIALFFSSRLLELEARRIEAATRLRLLTGLDEEPMLVLDPWETTTQVGEDASLRDDELDAVSNAIEENRARLRAAKAANGLRATLSGFLGIGTAESTFRGDRSDGEFSLYGARVQVSYPLFLGTTNSISILEARTDLAQSLDMQAAAMGRARMRAAEYRLREETSRKRIALLRESIAAATEREASLQRLVSAGVRTEGDLAQAQAERTRRELDLLTAEVERWKVARLLARMSATGSAGPPDRE